jgi:hypothetical protein
VEVSDDLDLCSEEDDKISRYQVLLNQLQKILSKRAAINKDDNNKMLLRFTK